MRTTTTVLSSLVFAWITLAAAQRAFAQPAAAEPASCSVRAFGAVGDGLADDTAAIRKAIAAGVGEVRFDPGRYRVTETITIELDKVGYTSLVADGAAQVIMAGAGPAFRFVGTHEGSAAPNTFEPNVWQRQRSPSVVGLEILGAHEEADGIEADGTMQLTISRSVLRKLRHGIHLVRRNRNVLISASHIYENRGIGVFYDQVNLHQSNIVGSHISYCRGGGVVVRGGDVRNIHIGTCDIESNMGPDGPPTANVLLDSTGGSVGEVAIAGCTIQHNSTSPDSANIRILGGGEGGRQGPTQEGHVTIGDNVLSDVRVNIHIRNARGVTITGNTFWMGYDHNVLVEDSSDIVMGANNLDRNPRYAYGDAATTRNVIVFRNCRDCTLSGVHLKGAFQGAAGLLLDRCERMNVTGCTVLDCEPVGLLLKDVRLSRVSDCLVRDDRKDAARAPALQVIGGDGNQIVDNLLSSPLELPQGAGTAKDNVVVPSEQSPAQEEAAKLSERMQQLVDGGRIAGGVTLLARHGKVLHLQSVGMADREAKHPMQPDSIFRIASMTKPVTSVAVMMLCEQGKLELDDPVSKYIPEFAKPQVLVTTDPLDMKPATREITIRDLLTHTSGLGYPFSKVIGPIYEAHEIESGLRTTPLTLPEAMQRLSRQPLLFSPGARFEYGLSTDVLGRVVEVASGATLDRYIEQRICRPLGMKDTFFKVPPEKLPRLVAAYVPAAQGIQRLEPGRCVQHELDDGTVAITSDYPYAKTQKYLSGGAGLCSTASDYARFCQMLLGGGRLGNVRLLGEETVRMMTGNQVGEMLGEEGFGFGFSVKPATEDIHPQLRGSYAWAGFWSTSFRIAPRGEWVLVTMSQLAWNDATDSWFADYERIAAEAMEMP
ncbi:MAG: serine hydrolase [Planctomycetota bacterium]